MADWLYGAGVGLVGGLVFGLTGYFKNGGDFDVGKLLPTVVLSGLAGLSLGLAGLSVDDENLQIAATGLTSAGIGIILQNLYKGVTVKKK